MSVRWSCPGSRFLRLVFVTEEAWLQTSPWCWALHGCGSEAATPCCSFCSSACKHRREVSCCRSTTGWCSVWLQTVETGGRRCSLTSDWVKNTYLAFSMTAMADWTSPFCLSNTPSSYMANGTRYVSWLMFLSLENKRKLMLLNNPGRYT